MKMVKLPGASATVAPDAVESVVVAERDESVIVTMKSGEKFRVMAEYNQSKWQTFDKINTAINEALA
ncbi:hypothetical protein RCCWILLIS_64 [Rhodobacter phage RcCWillis]|nr:hypothetical protein RCCWILLIS_64 [Rhodobacter phage RcCWillis]